MCRDLYSRSRDSGTLLAESVGVGSSSNASPSCFSSTGKVDGLTDGLRAHLARECPSASYARTRSLSITSREHEGFSHRGRLSATIYGSRHLSTRMGTVWTLRVLRRFQRERSTRIRRDRVRAVCARCSIG